jgi:type II secretory pathway pseudopilin PulG
MKSGLSTARVHPLNRRPQDSFTLVELLTVILIIMILASLTLAAANSVMGQAARSRARSEIQALSTALESYKTDNGIYPLAI